MIAIGTGVFGLGVFVTVAAVWQAVPDPARLNAPEGMVYVAGGPYRPLYPDPADTSAQAVPPFFLDRHPVTNAEFLAFVQENPAWRRSQVRPVFADEGYLKHWQSDLDFGPDSMAHQPVVNVSWFAARAYAAWKGRRLPTTAEWEVAAAAQPPDDRMTCDEPDLCGLHGRLWEWVEDFDAALVTGESRNNADLDLTLFCGSGAAGASDVDDYDAFLRFAFRSGLAARFTVSSLGFRCAADLPQRRGRP